MFFVCNFMIELSFCFQDLSKRLKTTETIKKLMRKKCIFGENTVRFENFVWAQKEKVQ